MMRAVFTWEKSYIIYTELIVNQDAYSQQQRHIIGLWLCDDNAGDFYDFEGMFDLFEIRNKTKGRKK